MGLDVRLYSEDDQELELKENIDEGIDFNIDEINKVLPEEAVMNDEELEDFSTEDLDGEEPLNDDDLLDDELFDNDLAKDNLLNDDDIIDE